MVTLEEIKKSFLASIWFMFLTFPIMVIRVNTIYNIVEWRWERMFMVGLGSFFLSFVWRYLLKRKELGRKKADIGEADAISWSQKIYRDRRFSIPALIAVSAFVLPFRLFSRCIKPIL